MITEKTPKGLRLHIGLFGRRNVGKSSLLNSLVGQQISVVSDIAGTTTDPVEKPMELRPIGPVLFIDTAGIDDAGALGELRVTATRRVLDRIDLGIIVAEADRWGAFEQGILDELAGRQTPTIVALNKSDLGRPDPDLLGRLADRRVPVVQTAASLGLGIDELRQTIIRCAPEEVINAPALLSDLVGPGQMAILVVPIDKAAPRGRLILPQVQAIRDLLDGDACCLVVRENRLAEALARLDRPPALVVTDSQVFSAVAAIVSEDIPMTSFSILFARAKGDLNEMVSGAMAIDRLRPGGGGDGTGTPELEIPRILVAEACSHHPTDEDIGRVKIPKWLQRHVGRGLHFEHVQGPDFPDDLTPYMLVIHCGACMFNRRLVLSRMLRCAAAKVPMTNYGLVIARSLGILQRALKPFPAALETCRTMGLQPAAPRT